MFLEWENNSGKLQIVSGKIQNSGKFQNNTINDVKQISLSNVIISWIICHCFLTYYLKARSKATYLDTNIKIVPVWSVTRSVNPFTI